MTNPTRSIPDQQPGVGTAPARPAASPSGLRGPHFEIPIAIPVAQADNLATPPVPIDDDTPGSFDALDDVELDLTIELGRTEMALEDVAQLRSGSVVLLDKLAGDPVDVVVNGRLIARGEVVVVDQRFCVRVTELVPATGH
jgi:flagellar motor switch protein FliN